MIRSRPGGSSSRGDRHKLSRRDVLKGLAAAEAAALAVRSGVLLAQPQPTLPPSVQARDPDLIRRENQRPGTREWMIFNASSCWWADGLSEPPGYVRPAVYTSPKGPDSRAQRITRNLLEKMRA